MKTGRRRTYPSTSTGALARMGGGPAPILAKTPGHKFYLYARTAILPRELPTINPMKALTTSVGVRSVHPRSRQDNECPTCKTTSIEALTTSRDVHPRSTQHNECPTCGTTSIKEHWITQIGRPRRCVTANWPE